MVGKQLLSAVLFATALCASVKVKNDMGKGITVNVACASTNPNGLNARTLINGKYLVYSWHPKPSDCQTKVWCDVRSSNGKRWRIDVIDRTCPDPFGDQRAFFLHKDGVYQGDWNGKGLVLKHKW